jgi:hypothetical protein
MDRKVTTKTKTEAKVSVKGIVKTTSALISISVVLATLFTFFATR